MSRPVKHLAPIFGFGFIGDPRANDEIIRHLEIAWDDDPPSLQLDPTYPVPEPQGPRGKAKAKFQDRNA